MESDHYLMYLSHVIIATKQEAMMSNNITLGMKVRDEITGQEGIVTAITSYLTGCNRAGIEAQDESDVLWFDMPRLEQIGHKVFGYNEEARAVGGGPNPTDNKNPR